MFGSPVICRLASEDWDLSISNTFGFLWWDTLVGVVECHFCGGAMKVFKLRGTCQSNAKTQRFPAELCCEGEASAVSWF